MTVKPRQIVIIRNGLSDIPLSERTHTNYNSWLGSCCGAGWEKFSETPEVPYTDPKYGIRVVLGEVVAEAPEGVQIDVIQSRNGVISVINATKWMQDTSNPYKPGDRA